jgi:hypothetical protein
VKEVRVLAGRAAISTGMDLVIVVGRELLECEGLGCCCMSSMGKKMLFCVRGKKGEGGLSGTDGERGVSDSHEVGG